MLKKCNGDPDFIRPIKGICFKHNLSYEEVLVQIIDRQVMNLRNKEVVCVKDVWENHPVEGETWEAEAEKKSYCPFLFET